MSAKKKFYRRNRNPRPKLIVMDTIHSHRKLVWVNGKQYSAAYTGYGWRIDGKTYIDFIAFSYEVAG